jgi:hypothetical protein
VWRLSCSGAALGRRFVRGRCLVRLLARANDPISQPSTLARNDPGLLVRNDPLSGSLIEGVGRVVDTGRVVVVGGECEVGDGRGRCAQEASVLRLPTMVSA